MKKILFISSQGGHLEELLKLEILIKKYNSFIISEKTSTTSFLKKQYKNVSYLLYGTKDHLLLYMIIFPINIILSFIKFFIIRPDYIISTGTHTAIPMILIAKFFKKKIIYFETFANRDNPSKSGKIAYKYADLFLVQWQNCIKFYPKAKFWGSLF